jgi:D-alanine transaminase
MSRFAYVNGRYLPHRQATLHVEDRGLQFADGVYEVIAVWKGCLVDEERHFERLERSLEQLRIEKPLSRAALKAILRETIRRNRVRNGMVYAQVTRGVAHRDHAFPKDCAASLIVTATSGLSGLDERKAGKGVSVVTLPDNRWGRCDIKTVSLLPNVLAKQQAREARAYEAWFVDGRGHVTEGASTNAWIVSKKGRLVTHPLGPEILGGITRAALLRIARQAGIGAEERPFTVREARSAREALITSTTSFVLPVVRIDGTAIGNGRPGPVARSLRRSYLAYMSGGNECE